MERIRMLKLYIDLTQKDIFNKVDREVLVDLLSVLVIESNAYNTSNLVICLDLLSLANTVEENRKFDHLERYLEAVKNLLSMVAP